MEFTNLDELKQLFISSDFSFPKEMMVAGVKYTINRTSSYSIEEMIRKDYKAMWIYFTAYPEQARSVGLEHAIIFLWGFMPNKYVMIPYDVRTLSKARLQGRIITETMDNGNTINIPKDKVVGDVVDVMITNIPNSSPMKGKIDTGADISSIHAESWNIDNGQVSFDCPELSENKITLPVIEKQAIKSSNGDMEYRPVIELNIKINEQQLTNVMFNLNDRGTMNYPMLIGQNVLEVGGFMIDPTINDPDAIEENIEIDWESLQEEFENDTIVTEDENELIEKVIKFIRSEM